MKNSKHCLIDWLGALHDSHKGSVVWFGGEAKGISEILDTTVDELNTMAKQLCEQPVKHGHWIPYNTAEHERVYDKLFMCSKCERWGASCTNYCSYCGADMR